MTTMTTKAEPPPGHITVTAAMKRLHIDCRRKILTEYVRLGLLPYPTHGVWLPEADVERVAAMFEERRRKAGMTGPR
jgi:hypothetical protein